MRVFIASSEGVEFSPRQISSGPESKCIYILLATIIGLMMPHRFLKINLVKTTTIISSSQLKHRRNFRIVCNFKDVWFTVNSK